MRPLLPFLLAIAVIRSCPMVDGVVDRIEGDLAVVVTEDGREIRLPAKGLKEGDVLVGGRVDPEATRRRREEVRDLIDERGPPPEDIEL